MEPLFGHENRAAMEQSNNNKNRMKVLLIYPRTPDTFWSFKYVMPFISKRAAFPPLGLLTIAAMMPDDWQFKLVDLNVRWLTDNDLRWADYVMISAMIVHKTSVLEIADRCRRLAKPMIAGGPLFTTGHADFPSISHFVLGEAEAVMPQLVEDMDRGTLHHTYADPGRPDITGVPAPRWDLINFKDYAAMAVQFSRGCPFDCEFCDIIVMNGRVPRTKSPAQLIDELEQLRLRGWQDSVFVVDDNFIGKKKQAKELLRALVEWRTRTGTKMSCLTEASANLADDPELCSLMVRAGFRKVFVGIETPSTESLDECRKVQNLRRDLVETVKTLQRAGLEVMGGFIVGFDNDKMDIFERQFEFIQRSGVVAAMVGLLTALPETRLYQRLMKEGRLETESSGNNTDAVLNFRPRLDREFLINGYRQLMQELYAPRNYYERIRTFLEHHTPCGPQFRLSWSDLKALAKSLWLLGIVEPGRFAYWRFSLTTLLKRPGQFYRAMELVILGYHFRRVASRL
jgi:radical SAM superfamily enzyme YgiQ (UPF0313 family)